MTELQSIIVFYGPHFVRHLGIRNSICVKLLQLMCAVITHNSLIKRSLYINKGLSYSQLQCFTAAILSVILEFVILFVSNSYRLCPLLFCAIYKNDVSISNRFPGVHKRKRDTHTHTYTHTHTHIHNNTHTHTHTHNNTHTQQHTHTTTHTHTHTYKT